MDRRSLLMLGLLAPVAATRTARGQSTLAPPTGRVILTINGRIRSRNSDDAAVFDRAMLEALGTERFTTATPWHEGPQSFEGVPMARLLRHVGAEGETITVTALNDYRTEIPVADFERFGTILALKRQGEYMPVRDRGPLFIVYPYDSRPELQARLYYSRSAWQVATITVS